MKLAYDLDKIKFATDKPTYERAVGLYEADKVTQFREELNGFFAVVLGSKQYEVYVSRRHYDQGNCECYLGQRGILCKHMVAVAIYAVKNGKKLNQKEKKSVNSPVCSNKTGELDKDELGKIKKAITSAMRYIKGYRGPSRTWFAYQNSLDEGCARLSKIVSEIPISKQTAKLLVNTLLRLEKKICGGGVDDSNGTVGGFMYEVVEVLKLYAEIDLECISAFEVLCGRETCFDWENDLIRIFDEQ